MLALRPLCEHCGKDLPPNDLSAMICSFECTFCKDCVTAVLENVCPNCGGGFVNMPIRPSALLEKYPASTDTLTKPVDFQVFTFIRDRNKGIDPSDR